MKKVLLTGGAGYIGSHTCVSLLNAGFEVVVYDNFSNSNPNVIGRIEALTGKTVACVRGDIRDKELLERALLDQHCNSVIHLAGLKAVGESTAKPLLYFDNNVIGTLRLLEAMAEVGIYSLVFSSSATVYGDPQYLPLDENHPLSATNPYGRTKLMIEDILRDLYRSDPKWHVSILRYFNPVGAHESGQLGENPLGVPNNLMPFVAQVAVGRREVLQVWGNDYPTPDGTGIRDYIHVMDLAEGHVKALQNLSQPQCLELNLGTGSGYSVLQLIDAFGRAAGKTIPYQFANRRPGDIAACYANPDSAKRHLGWEAKRDLDAMCRDAWNWQHHNPDGYAS